MPSFNISKILVFSFMLGLLNLTTEAAVTFLAYNCPNTTTFTPNGTYQRNLNFLLSSLTSNATRDNGFYKLAIGQDPSNMIYGLYLCRGDVTKKLCQECVTTASKELLRRCPKERVSLIYYDECLIRYSDQYIFSTVQRDPDLQLLNTQNIVEPDRFMQLLGRTINDIAARAANDQSGKMFATEEANFTIFQTLYTLAQCTPDLSVGDCDLCLRGAISNLPGCCNGKQGGRVLFPSCNVRYEVYPFYRIMEAPPPPPKGRQKTSSLIIIAIVALIAVSVLLFTGGYCYLSRKARTKYNVIQQEENVGTEIMIVESLQFDLGTIQAATNNFSDDNKLGEGGFGEVFKGTLPNGQEIAVKRLSRGSGQGAAEFKNEAVLVAKLQHRNLVRLLGFCLEGEEKMLVYEFVPNKSLDYFLFNPEKRGQLDWSRRYKMIGGIARGILYLHEDFWLRIIHRDLKARNILLDGDMTPKISDFGMARIFGVDQTQGNTSRIFGTFGYMAPEYAMHGQFSVKSDVYSFGVLILETISGKKNNSFCQSEDAEDLLSYAYKLWKDGAPLELMDPTLSDSYSRNEVIRCIHIGLLCVQENPADRPSMSTIVLMLNSFSVTLPLPQQPALFLHSRRESDMPTTELGLDQSRSQSIPWSVNEASITELQPR